MNTHSVKLHSRKRRYRSVLRAEQVDLTRTRLLEAAGALLSEGGSDVLTVTAVAARAQVSAPTAYRYFASRQVLLEALGEWISERVGTQGDPRTLDETPAFAAQLFERFDGAEQLCRAQLNTPAGREVRRLAQRRRHQAVRHAVEASFKDLDPRRRTGLAAVVQSLASLPTWVAMKDYWGLSSPDSGQWVAWAITVLGEAARAHPGRLPRTGPGVSDRRRA